MRQRESAIGRLLRDVVSVATSKERLRQQLQVSLYRNALYLMASTAIMAIVGLAFWVVTTRWLYQAATVGRATAVISAAMLLALFATLGLDYALIRFLPNSREKPNDVVNTCLTIGGLASVLAALIFIAGLGFWSPALLFLRHYPVYFVAFVVFTACWTLYGIQTRTFIARRRSGFSLAQGITFNLLRFPLVVVLAAFSTVLGIFASWGIAVMAALVIGALLLPRVQAGYRPRPVIKRKVVDEMIHYSFANYISVLLWSVPMYIMPIMVINWVGADANAYFFSAWSAATILFAIPFGMNISLFAEGSHDEERLGRDIRRSLKFTFVLLVPAILLVILLGHEVLSLFGPDYAHNATRLLWVLALSAVPVGLNDIYCAVRRVEMKMKSVIYLNAFITVTTIALSWVLLPRMGILGVGVAWLISHSMAALVIISLWLPRTQKAS